MNPNNIQNSVLDQVVPRSSGLGTGIAGILNQLFYAGLVVAVALALAMVIRGAIQYMTTDGGDAKGSAKKRIQAALGGLVLAFSAILVLNTINPSLTQVRVRLEQLRLSNGSGTGLDTDENGVESGTRPPGNVEVTGPIRTEDGRLVAQFTEINNPDSRRASAEGAIVLNGTTYTFISGGGGKGYLPPGEYTITDGRLRSDNSSMMVDGYGYSFNLSDAYDPRVGAQRELLRIHPDGGSPGTIGCIGIQGSRATQEQFYRDLQSQIGANGGSYTIKVGQ